VNAAGWAQREHGDLPWARSHSTCGALEHLDDAVLVAERLDEQSDARIG
jgi:hypothetical protein